MDFSTPISELMRVGKTTAKKMERLGVKTAGDLLYYFPFRYEDYRQIVPINDLKEGMVVTVVGRVELIANRRSHRSRKNLTEALVSDATGSLRVVWFNQPFLIKNLKVGDDIFLSGTIKTDMLGPELISPIYEKSTSNTNSTARLVPMYPLTDGVTQKQIRYLVKQVLPLTDLVPEWLSEKILETNALISLTKALRGINFPENEENLRASTERLKFDELFLLQLRAEIARLKLASLRAPELLFQEKEIKELVGALPFTLTSAQKIAAWEILQDISKNHSMNRLLSGDVGSGKTVVAAMAMYSAALSGYQAVLMAPTEILARQHFDTICKILGDKLSVGLLTGSKSEIFNCHSERSEEPLSNPRKGILHFTQDDKCLKRNGKKDIVEKINSGEINIIIGTHALLLEGVKFDKLGLVIVDEQHRFGVEQRKIIKEKGESVHFLSMTATPIPRTLGLVIYGDLDISTINELPPDRKKIISRVVEPSNRQKAYDFIRSQIKQGRQAFVICPLIEADNEKKSVLSEYKKLSEQIFPDLRVGYLHGRLKPVEKELSMNKFKNGELDILVSTSVVEVGVDIPNASVMMIEGADRFGLAQLHQFRGRVGRSKHQSYCFLFTDSDSSTVEERLRFFENNNDGFKLAEKDLELRGPGEVYGAGGAEQSGMMRLRLAKLTDQEIIKKARSSARQIAPEIENYPSVLEKIQEWEKEVHLE